MQTVPKPEQVAFENHKRESLMHNTNDRIKGSRIGMALSADFQRQCEVIKSCTAPQLDVFQAFVIHK